MWVKNRKIKISDFPTWKGKSTKIAKCYRDWMEHKFDFMYLKNPIIEAGVGSSNKHPSQHLIFFDYFGKKHVHTYFDHTWNNNIDLSRNTYFIAGSEPDDHVLFPLYIWKV